VLGCHLASCIAQLERQYCLLIIVTFVGGPRTFQVFASQYSMQLGERQMESSSLVKYEWAASKGENASKDEQLASRFWSWLSRYKKVKAKRSDSWNMTIHRWVMISVFVWQWNWGTTNRDRSTKRWICQPSASLKHVKPCWQRKLY